MPCEHYKDSLAEAAATGVEPQGELRAHLAACASCRAAFAEEQALFASIDAGLRATANAEVPASLLPRVRAAVAQEALPNRAWFSNRIVYALAAVALLALTISIAFWRLGPGRSVEPTVANNNPPTLSPRAPQVQAPNAVHQLNSNFAHRSGATIASNRTPQRAAARSSNLPEVVVPSDQNALLARYAEEWSRHKRTPLLAEDSQEATLVPMQVAPIQIAQLDVKLLTEEKSQ